MDGSSCATVVNGATPFLKWPGGKRWLVSTSRDIAPREFGTYVEPFLGAGSMFLHLQPKHAILADLNLELIDTYRAVRDMPEALLRSLRRRQRLHDADEGYYYRVRGKRPLTPKETASRFIYLNRTCFNGMYRVNKSGAFNVPRGSKNSVVKDSDDFAGISALLKKAEIIAADFEPVIELASKGDFVFADPPYTINHNENGFLKYNEVLFSWSDQVRLAEALRAASDRGAYVLCTNANHESVRNLYRGTPFRQSVLGRMSRLAGRNSGRGRFEELVIQANY